MTATTGGSATNRSEQPVQPLPEKIARIPEQVQLVLKLNCPIIKIWKHP
jgi:hypothetical protein